MTASDHSSGIPLGKDLGRVQHLSFSLTDRLITVCIEKEIWVLNIQVSRNFIVNPLTPRVSYGDIEVILTFESVDEILQCDHLSDSSSAALSHGTIYILVFCEMKFEICLKFVFRQSWE